LLEAHGAYACRAFMSVPCLLPLILFPMLLRAKTLPIPFRPDRLQRRLIVMEAAQQAEQRRPGKMLQRGLATG